MKRFLLYLSFFHLSFFCFSQKYAALNTRLRSSIEPTVQDASIVFSAVQKNQFTISWTNNGAQTHLVVVRASGVVDDVPLDGVVYNDNSVFATGDQVGIFNYVVYKGSGNSVTVTGLTTNTRYHVRVFAVNGSEGLGYANYLTTTATGNPANQATLIESDLIVTVYTGNLDSFGQPNSDRQWGNLYNETSTVINSSIYDQIQLEINVTVATASPNNPRAYLGYAFAGSPPYYDASKVIGTQSVGTDAVTISYNGVKTTNFLTIPVAAKTIATRFLLVENGGDGSSPRINSMIIRCKQIPVP